MTPTNEVFGGNALDDPRAGGQSVPDPDLSINGHIPSEVYVYRDAGGHPVGAVARYAPGTLDPDRKTFRQFRWESEKWIPGLAGRRLPPYRLPELIVAVHAGETILVVEGEGCVEALADLGFVATTNPGGAGKWRSADSEHVREADVVVLPDNDDVGRRHAEQVARACHLIAKRIRVLDLPGLLDKGDVVDWIRAGGTTEALLDLVEEAPVFRPHMEVGEEWDDPTPIGVSEESHEFPIAEALPGTLSEIAAAISETVKVDVAAPATLLPVVVSTAAGNGGRVRVSKGYAEPNLARYAAWAAPSGERKSETFRRITAPLGSWEEGRAGDFDREVTTWQSDSRFQEKRAQEAEKSGAKAKDAGDAHGYKEVALEARLAIPPPPRKPMLHFGDVTSEALVRLISGAGGGFGVLSADARHIVDAILGRYRSDKRIDDSVYLRAHGGDRIDRGRIGGQSEGEYLVVERPSLGVAVAVQPDKLREAAQREELLASGLFPRFNVVSPRSLVGERMETGDEAPMDEVLLGRWKHIVHRIADDRWRRLPAVGEGCPQVVELVLDPEAMVLRRAFHNELERRQAPGGDLAGVSAFGSKTAGEAARLAALFHLTTLAEEGRLGDPGGLRIPVSTWTIAEVHQRWQLDETLRALALAREDEHARTARRVLKWAAAAPQKRRVVAARELIGARIFEGVDSAKEGMEWLVDRGWARPGAKKGKERAPRWEIHPIAFGEAKS